jgi:hypothetical protein
VKPLTAREMNSTSFGRRNSVKPYQPHKTGYAILNSEGAELQWSESLAPLMKHIGEKSGVRIVRMKDQVVVWPVQSEWENVT